MKHDELWTIFSGIADRMQASKLHVCIKVPHNVFETIELVPRTTGTHFPNVPLVTPVTYIYHKVEGSETVDVVYECEDNTQHAHKLY